MECNQQQTTVAATRTLYENFIEEKCESDLLIPDYFPAAEKIIQCSAAATITRKDVEGDRLILEGNCRFCVIYQGEEGSGIKSLSETASFAESFPLKDSGKDPWAQAVVRVSGTGCRLLNPRKISTRATVSVALKVKDQRQTETIEDVDCNEAEALFAPATVYTILEHTADTTKVQGEIEVHTEIQDVLKTEGSVCIKDVKILPGKAIVKGIVDLYVLFTPESDPCRVESTSTAIPFSQILELQQREEEGLMEAAAQIQNIRCDVETDESGKNRVISLSATLSTEGEVFENKEHRLLMDAYSNRYPIETQMDQLTVEEMVDQGEIAEVMRFEMPIDAEGEAEIIQALGNPVIQKITGQDKTLSIEGILGVSAFMREGESYRSVDKSFPFTLKYNTGRLDGHMRCEVRPCVMSLECSAGKENAELKAEIACNVMVFARNTYDVISGMEVDAEHPLERERSAPLVVYYGEKGERLWDIARKYATSVSNIKSLNDLNRDELEEKKLLLISR